MILLKRNHDTIWARKASLKTLVVGDWNWLTCAFLFCPHTPSPNIIKDYRANLGERYVSVCGQREWWVRMMFMFLWSFFSTHWVKSSLFFLHATSLSHNVQMGSSGRSLESKIAPQEMSSEMSGCFHVLQWLHHFHKSGSLPTEPRGATQPGERGLGVILP